jgi:outer membrane lipoprotein LolB
MTAAARAALLSAALLLAGCKTLPTGPDGLSFEQRRDALEAVDAWEMRGRLAIDTGDRGFQGSFSWRQRQDTLDLAVRGPLGQGVLQVVGPAHTLTMTARGETRTLTDPETELSALLGWWLPVASLPAWLLGLPDRAFRYSTEPGIDGTLAALEQRLWRVDFSAYQLANATIATSPVLVPRRIEMKYGELALRLTIDDWHPSATARAP